MSELLESVKRLAEAQAPLCVADSRMADEDGDTFCRFCGIGLNIKDRRPCTSRENIFPALAKHIARLERVEVAAKARKAAYDAAPGTPYGVDETPELEEAERALDAALSENPDVE